MKINKPALILSLLTLIIACSLLSMTSVGKDYRFTWVAMNPWNGVEGIAYTVKHFLHTSKSVTNLLSAALLLVIWWRLYALYNRGLRKE